MCIALVDALGLFLIVPILCPFANFSIITVSMFPTLVYSQANSVRKWQRLNNRKLNKKDSKNNK